MCWRCDAVRRAVGYDDNEAVFEVDDEMLDGYARRHGVTREQAADAFVFAAAGLQPSQRWH